VRAMVGRELPPRAVSTTGAALAAEALAKAAPILAVESLARRPCFTNVTLSVRAGEIVGLFGLVGSGRSELLETIFGLFTPDAGRVDVDGRPVAPRSPREAALAGIALVPEERQRQGLFFNLTLRDNLL